MSESSSGIANGHKTRHSDDVHPDHHNDLGASGIQEKDGKIHPNNHELLSEDSSWSEERKTLLRRKEAHEGTCQCDNEKERIKDLNKTLITENSYLHEEVSCLRTSLSHALSLVNVLSSLNKIKSVERDLHINSQQTQTPENKQSKEKAGWVRRGKAPLMGEEKENSRSRGLLEKCPFLLQRNFTEESDDHESVGRSGKRKKERKKTTKLIPDPEKAPCRQIQSDTGVISDSEQNNLRQSRPDVDEQNKDLEEADEELRVAYEIMDERHSAMKWLREVLWDNKNIPTKSCSPKKGVQPSTPAKPSAERAFLLLAEMLAHIVTCHEEGRLSLTGEELDTIKEIRHRRNILAHPKVEGMDKLCMIKKTLLLSDTLVEEKACFLNNESQIEKIVHKFLKHKDTSSMLAIQL